MKKISVDYKIPMLLALNFELLSENLEFCVYLALKIQTKIIQRQMYPHLYIFFTEVFNRQIDYYFTDPLKYVVINAVCSFLVCSDLVHAIPFWSVPIWSVYSNRKFVPFWSVRIWIYMDRVLKSTISTNEDCTNLKLIIFDIFFQKIT